MGYGATREEGLRGGNSEGRDAIVLVHGWIGSSALWDLLLPLLSPGRRVLAPDLPGHGGAGIPPGFAFTLDGFAGFIRQLALAEGIGSMVLVGHSMGGMIALHYARQYPEEVARLVLIDTPHRSRSLAWPNRLPFLEAATFLASPFWREPTFARFIRSSVRHPESLPEDFLRRAAARASLVDRRALLATTHLVRHFDLSREAGEVVAPTMLIHGEHDRSVKLSEARRLCALLRNAVFRLIPDCGHCPIYEYPELVVDLIEEWLDGGEVTAISPSAT